MKYETPQKPTSFTEFTIIVPCDADEINNLCMYKRHT